MVVASKAFGLNIVGTSTYSSLERTLYLESWLNGTFTGKDARYRIDQNIDSHDLAHTTTWGVASLTPGASADSTCRDDLLRECDIATRVERVGLSFYMILCAMSLFRKSSMLGIAVNALYLYNHGMASSRESRHSSSTVEAKLIYADNLVLDNALQFDRIASADMRKPGCE
ncbi:hypothetical protein Tco_0367643 [Tanacetum coccineum]